MSAVLLPQGKQQYFTNTGDPLVGGQVFTYDTGTTTPRTTWADSAQASPNANPIILDARGEATIFWSGAYRVVVKDSLGNTIWTVDGVADLGRTELANSVSASLGAALVGYNPALTYPVNTVGGWLNHFYARTAAEIAAGVTPTNYWYEPGNVLRYGTNTTPGTTDMTTAVQAAHNQANSGGAQPFLPAGSYLITTAISPSNAGMVGEGPSQSGLLCNACNAFTIPSNAGWSRKQAVFRDFSINSNNGSSCDAKWAFYFGGVAGGAAVVYNSGFICENISIGRTGRMGGVFYIKDVFGAKVQDISVTDAERVVQLVGSVAQSSFSNIDALLSAGAGTGLGGSVGFSTESASYASGTLTPEHITTHDLSLIVFNIGVSHQSGLDVNFYDTDTQTVSIGMAINAAADVKGGIMIPHSSGVTSWSGVTFGVNPGPKEGRFVSNIDVSVFNSPGTPASSYGFDMGDGASPVYGVVIKECTVKGNAGGLQSLIRGRVNKDLTIENCILEAAVALGTELSLSSVQRLNLSFNQCAAGIFAVGDGGDATANGVIVGNQITTLTLSPLTSPQNWTTGQNDGLTPVRFAWEQGTFTATLTGCTTSPTGVCTWVKNGSQVTLYIPTINGVSNTAACTFTGLPAAIFPNVQQDVLGRAVDNSLNGICGYRIPTAGGIVQMFFGPTLGAWTAAGNKGTNSTTLTYSLA